MCRNRILQRRILRLRRVAKRQILFRRSAIHAERILLYRKCNAISYKVKIESCKAGFSACGGSRSDKFCSAAVRSTRSAFFLYRKCDAISYIAKKPEAFRSWLLFHILSKLHTQDHISISIFSFGQALDRLVTVSSIHCYTSTSALST